MIDATNVDISLPGGGSFCTQAYLEAMLALFPDQVDVMHPKEANIRDERYTTIDVPGRSIRQQLVGFCKGQFHRAGQFLIDYLNAHQSEYQWVLVSTGLFAGNMIPHLHAMGIQVIVLHHNFEPEYRMDSRSILTMQGKTDKLVRYWERKGYQAADINLFLTLQDRQTFEVQYGPHPNNYVSGVFEPTDQCQVLNDSTPTPSAVITCALNDIQNQAPLLRFAKQYLPVFQEMLPDWHIELMGRKPAKAICDLAARHPTIHLTPNPEDIRSLAAKSAIYLCPMDAGGGLKLRIMDGLRAGQPVLVHERAARGYDIFKDCPFFCTYHDKESFYQSLSTIVDYIQSDTYSRQIVQTEYYAQFGLAAGTNRLATILCK